MDTQIGLLLGQDGLVNGAIYALLALALVLVFSVTRVIFIPQGELVTWSALSMASLHEGRSPATFWLLVALAAVTLGVEALRAQRGAVVAWRWTVLWAVAFPAAAGALLLCRAALPPVLQALAAVAIVTPIAPLLYRITYRPIAGGTVLLLLIVSVALHGVLVGLGLLFFGAEGFRVPELLALRLEFAGLQVGGQSLLVVGTSGLLVVAFAVFFRHSLLGKALRATAMNRTGARLMGIPTELAGDMSFALAGLTGAVAGVLVGPLSTVYYDSGFLICLKGFVAAIIGGLGSYALALGGALLVGQLESFSSFWASSFKEVIVFTLIIPVLAWRSMRTRQVEEAE